jgi:TOTE conflict system primase-like protein
MERTGMDHRLPATPELAREFSELFVNRRAYTIQSMRPQPESGRHYYYRPKSRPTGLSLEIVRQHLAGELTIGIYAINPATQRCKWMAIDADYKMALEDLIKVQRQLRDDGIEAASTGLLEAASEGQGTALAAHYCWQDDSTGIRPASAQAGETEVLPVEAGRVQNPGLCRCEPPGRPKLGGALPILRVARM